MTTRGNGPSRNPEVPVENHVCCTHWEPLPGGREVCCDCGNEGDVDNPQADGVYEQVVRLRAALGDVLFMVEDANGNLTGENLSDIRDCVMSALDLHREEAS